MQNDYTTREYSQAVRERWRQWEGLVLLDDIEGVEAQQRAFDEGAELTWPQWVVRMVSWTVVGMVGIAVMTAALLLLGTLIERGM